MCPNMINFHAFDFSECRSEELVSSFFQCRTSESYNTSLTSLKPNLNPNMLGAMANLAKKIFKLMP